MENEITKEERDQKKEKKDRQNSNKLTIGPPWVHVEPSHWLYEIFVSKIVCHRLFTWLDAKPCVFWVKFFNFFFEIW
jgi:hypothetical protein